MCVCMYVCGVYVCGVYVCVYDVDGMCSVLTEYRVLKPVPVPPLYCSLCVHCKFGILSRIFLLLYKQEGL